MSRKKYDLVELLDLIDNKYYLDDLFQDVQERAMEELDRDMTPTTKENHIGIEFECYSKKNVAKVFQSIKKHKLFDYTSIGDDSSIECPDNTYGYEFRFLFPEDRFHLLFKRFKSVIKECGIKTNASCGIHVHLDMRSRDKDRVLKNLFTCIPIMKKLTKKSRHRNSYCLIEDSWKRQVYDRTQDTWYYDGPSKYRAINAYSAYRHHQTYEVRLHEATTDIDKVIKWCKFLVSVANHGSTLKSSKQVPDKVKLLRGVKTYLKAAV